MRKPTPPTGCQFAAATAMEIAQRSRLYVRQARAHHARVAGLVDEIIRAGEERERAEARERMGRQLGQEHARVIHGDPDAPNLPRGILNDPPR